MKKKLFVMLLMTVMSISLLTGCGGYSNINSDKDKTNRTDEDESEDDEDDTEESRKDNRDTEIIISNDEISCTIAYDSQVITYEMNDAYERMAPAAFINHADFKNGDVFFNNDLSEETPQSAREIYQEHSNFLYEYRTDVSISELIEYTSEDGYVYSCFNSSSKWYGTEYNFTLICVQATDECMLAIVFDDDAVEFESLEEFVESSFYLKDVSVREVETTPGMQQESEVRGSISITWDSEATDAVTGQPYNLDVLLEGRSNDNTAISRDADGERYLDAQGNVVAIVKETVGQITIEFYNTDVYYTISIENNEPVNGWTDYTTITCDLPGNTEFNQWDHYYRGGTGIWYFSFGVENGRTVSVY